MKIPFTAITVDNSCYVFMFGEEDYTNFLNYNQLDISHAPSWPEALYAIINSGGVVDYDIPNVARTKTVSLWLGVEDYVWQRLITKYPLVNFIGARLFIELT